MRVGNWVVGACAGLSLLWSGCASSTDEDVGTVRHKLCTVTGSSSYDATYNGQNGYLQVNRFTAAQAMTARQAASAG